MNQMRLADALFNQTSDCVAVIGLDGLMLEVNKRFEELHRWKSDEIVGGILPMVPEQARPDVLHMLERIAQGEVISGIDIDLLRRDGSSFSANVSLFPLRNDESAVIACVGIGRDVTEKKRSEEIIRKSEKLSVVGGLAAGIAHEIRNPLTSLKGFMQLLKEQNTQYTDIMLRELERINNIVNEFMSMAKPHSMRLLSVDLVTVIAEIVSFMQPQALLHKAEITMRLDGRHHGFVCEPNQIKQLLMNLLKNAIEAMPSGGDIEIAACREQNGAFVIRVIDHGEGMPEEAIARLGEPFYSLKENGTGLGIVVCHRIVEAHGGSLSFKSKVGEGTAVEMRFPSRESKE